MCSMPDWSPIWNDSVAFSHWFLLLILWFKQRMPCKQLLRLHVPCWTNLVSTGPWLFGPQLYPQVLIQGRAQSNSSRGRRKFIVIYFTLVLMYCKYKVYKTIIVLLVCTNNRILSLCWPYCEHFRCANPFRPPSIPMLYVLNSSCVFCRWENRLKEARVTWLMSDKLGFEPRQLPYHLGF